MILEEARAILEAKVSVVQMGLAGPRSEDGRTYVIVRKDCARLPRQSNDSLMSDTVEAWLNMALAYVADCDTLVWRVVPEINWSCTPTAKKSPRLCSVYSRFVAYKAAA